MSLHLQEHDTPLIKVNAADSSGSSSGYDVKQPTSDGGMMSTGSAFDPTTIHCTSQDEALFQVAPLPMTQLQTNFMAKIMLEIRSSYAASSSSNINIGHHKRQKTETMANKNSSSYKYYNTDDSDNGHNNNEDESSYYQEYDNGGSTSSSNNDEDDDLVSLSSLALPRPPSFDILNKLETHPKTIQFVATAGGIITHCK